MPPPEPSRRDIGEALETIEANGSVFDPASIELRYLGLLTVERLGAYDDLSSWLETERVPRADLFEELRSFRGQAWAKRAMTWQDEGIPPVIVGRYPDEESGRETTAVVDGRGRVNYAFASGEPLHVWELRVR